MGRGVRFGEMARKIEKGGWILGEVVDGENWTDLAEFVQMKGGNGEMGAGWRGWHGGCL